jgi:hypothetical protein
VEKKENATSMERGGRSGITNLKRFRSGFPGFVPVEIRMAMWTELAKLIENGRTFRYSA